MVRVKASQEDKTRNARLAYDDWGTAQTFDIFIFPVSNVWSKKKRGLRATVVVAHDGKSVEVGCYLLV